MTRLNLTQLQTTFHILIDPFPHYTTTGPPECYRDDCSPRSSHSSRIDIVSNNVAAIRERNATKRASSILGDDLLIKGVFAFPHLSGVPCTLWDDANPRFGERCLPQRPLLVIIPPPQHKSSAVNRADPLATESHGSLLVSFEKL